MKKALVGSLLAGACAITCAFGFTACGKGGSSSTPDEKMTSEQWLSCFQNFIVEENFSLKQHMGGMIVGAMKLDGDTYYETVGARESIYVKDGLNYYLYNKESANDEWKKSSVSEQDYKDKVEYANSLVIAAAYSIGMDYDSFEYVNGKYVTESHTVLDGFVLEDVEITCQSLALKEVVCTWKGADVESDRRVTVDNIGNTQITIPSVDSSEPSQIITGNTVTAEQWEQAFIGLDVLTNYTLASPQDGVLRVDGTTYYYENNGTANYYSKEGDKYYQYTENGGVWTRVEITEKEHEIFVVSFSNKMFSQYNIGKSYDKFTYTEGKYCCNEGLEYFNGSYKMVIEKPVITFKDGKVVSMEYGSDPNARVVLGSIGSTKVELPVKYVEGVKA